MVWIGNPLDVTLNFFVNCRSRETVEMANRLSSCFALVDREEREP